MTIILEQLNNVSTTQGEKGIIFPTFTYIERPLIRGEKKEEGHNHSASHVLWGHKCNLDLVLAFYTKLNLSKKNFILQENVGYPHGLINQQG